MLTHTDIAAWIVAFVLVFGVTFAWRIHNMDTPATGSGNVSDVRAPDSPDTESGSPNIATKFLSPVAPAPLESAYPIQAPVPALAVSGSTRIIRTPRDTESTETTGATDVDAGLAHAPAPSLTDRTTRKDTLRYRTDPSGDFRPAASSRPVIESVVRRVPVPGTGTDQNPAPTDTANTTGTDMATDFNAQPAAPEPNSVIDTAATAESASNNESTPQQYASVDANTSTPLDQINTGPDCPTHLYRGGNQHSINVLARLGCPVP